MTFRKKRKTITLRHYAFDKQGKIISSDYISYNIGRKGLQNFRGLQVYNNDRILFIAEDIYKRQLFSIDLEINPIKNKLVLLKRTRVAKKLDISKVIAQRDNNFVILDSKRKELKACHILASGFYDNCLYFDYEGYMEANGNEGLVEIILKGSHLIIVTENSNLDPSFYAMFGSNYPKKRPVYKSLYLKGYFPAFIGNKLYAASSKRVETHMFIEPHFMINAETSKGKYSAVLATDRDTKDPVELEFDYNVVDSLKDDISEIPHIYDIELYSNRTQTRFINFDDIKGNIKSMELLPSGDANKDVIDVKMHTTAKIEFPYKHD